LERVNTTKGDIKSILKFIFSTLYSLVS